MSCLISGRALRITSIWILFLISMSPAVSAQTNVSVQESQASLLKAGKAALEDKLYELAQSQFEQYLKNAATPGKDSEDAAVLLLRALHEQGKNAEILALCKTRKSIFEKPQAADAFKFWNAFALYELGKHDDTLKDLSEFSKTYPQSEYAGRAMRLTAWSYLKTGKTNEALQAFAHYDKTYPASPETEMNLIEWGKTLLSAGQIKQAHEVFERLVKLPADKVVVQNGSYWYGLTLIEEKKWDDAAAVLLSLSANVKASDDLRAEALIAVAVPLSAVSKKDDALDALRRGMELAKSPGLKLKGEFAFAQYLVDVGRLDQGVPLLKQCIAKAPLNPMAEAAQLKIAGALQENKRYQEAVDEYQHFLETFTNLTGQAEALAGKGWALTGLSRHAEAAATFLKAYGLFTETTRKEQCLFKVGDSYFSNSQFKLAMETYEMFIKEFPGSKLEANALFQIGECVAGGDKPDDAEAKFKVIIEKFPDSPFAEEALLRIGEIKLAAGKWLESVNAFSRVMGVYSNGLMYAQALHGRGMGNYQLMKFDDAVRDFESVTNRFVASSVFEHSYYMIGRSCYWLGNDERALSIFTDFVKRYPDSQWAPDALFWMAKHHYNESAYEVAEKEFILFVQKYPKSQFADNALYWAGISSSRRKEYIHSIELLSRMAKEYPDSSKMAEARFAQAEALSELARFSEAILIFDEIITKYTASPLILAAWERKGDCQFGLGADDAKRYSESMESYRVVANNSKASLDRVMRSECQIGRCLEKLGRGPEAFQQYYKKVILRYFEDSEKGVRHNEACKLWFTRAVLNAADLLEIKKDWRGTARVLERLVKAGVPGADEARARIAKLKAEHWWLFYNE